MRKGVLIIKKFAKTRAFIEKNRKTLMIAVGILATGTLAIIGYNALEQSDPEPYTSQWLKGLSDDELPEEHEKARLAMRDAHGDCNQACKMDFWRRRIATEIELRKGDGTDDYVSPPHREHGNNLYKPE